MEKRTSEKDIKDSAEEEEEMVWSQGKVTDTWPDVPMHSKRGTKEFESSNSLRSRVKMKAGEREEEP